jgi:tetratricopeptide (TPR) repeat protein
MAIPLLSAASKAANWLWNKIRGRPTVQADRGAIAAGRDQVVKDSVIAAEQALRAGASAFVATIQHFHGPVFIAGMPERLQEPPDVAPKGPPEAFVEGQRLETEGDHAGAIAQYQEAFAEAWCDFNRGFLHIRIAYNLRRIDRVAEAEGHMLQALGLARGAAERELEALVLWGLGVHNAEDGNWDKAEAYSRDAMEVFRSVGEEEGAAHVTVLLARVHQEQRRLDDAEDCLTQALSAFQRLGDEEHQAVCLHYLGDVYRDRGNDASLSDAEEAVKQAVAFYKQAARHYFAASDHSAAKGDVASQARALSAAGRMSLACHEGSVAVQHCSSALTLFRQVGDEAGAAEAQLRLGGAQLFLGPVSGAEENLLQALESFEKLGDLRGQGYATVSLGMALGLRGDAARGEEKIREGQELLSQAGDRAAADGAGQFIQSLRNLERLGAFGHPQNGTETGRSDIPPDAP